MQHAGQHASYAKHWITLNASGNASRVLQPPKAASHLRFVSPLSAPPHLPRILRMHVRARAPAGAPACASPRPAAPAPSSTGSRSPPAGSRAVPPPSGGTVPRPLRSWSFGPPRRPAREPRRPRCEGAPLGLKGKGGGEGCTSGSGEICGKRWAANAALRGFFSTAECH